jgi:PAS domain S-box-containing protein
MQKTEQMLLRAILDNPEMSIISVGPDRLIQSFNRGAEELLGYKAEEVIGKVSPEIFHDQDEVRERTAQMSRELGMALKTGADAFVARTMLTGAPDVQEWTYIRKDGTRFRMLLEVSILRDENGAMQGYVGIAMRVPQWNQVEERRKTATAAK